MIAPLKFSSARKRNTRHLASGRTNRKQAAPDVSQVTLFFLSAPLHLPFTLVALVEVGLDFLAMAQIVPDGGVHIRQRQGIVLLHDHLRGRPILELLNQQLEQDSRVSDAQRAGCVLADGQLSPLLSALA